MHAIGNLTVDGNVGIGTTTPGAKLDVDGDVRISKGVLFEHSQSPIRRTSYSGTYTTRSNGELITEFNPSIEAKAGEKISLIASISGRPDAEGHTYFYLQLNGTDIGANARYAPWSPSSWIRTASIQHNMTAPSDGIYTFGLKLVCGSGTSNFGNNDRHLNWVLMAGGEI